MDTKALRAFVWAAKSQSFSVAAEQLHLSQSAISKRIAALEADLEQPLFDRIGRKVALTEAGQTLLPRAQTILLELEDSQRALSRLSGQVSGRLTVGISHHVGLRHLPPILRNYVQRYPQVQLDMAFLDSENACQQILRGELELAIVTLPLQPIAQLSCRSIWPDPLAVMVHAAHPLLQQTHVSAQQLAKHPAILPATTTYTRRIVEQAFAQEQIELQVLMSTNYLETIRMMVSVGLAWSVLPRSMLGTDLHELDIPQLTMSRQLGWVHHSSRTLSNAAGALIQLLNAESAA